MTKQLKRVREAAGDARDLDVLLERFEKQPESNDDGPLRDLIEFVERRRDRAQRPIEKIHARLKDRDFPGRLKKFLERTRLRGKADRVTAPTYLQGAQRSLALLTDKFFAAATADFHELAAMHAFRIQGKQLRYAMEIFAGAFDRTFREEHYPAIEELQEKLGRINDRATAQHLFEGWAGEDPPEELAEVAAEAYRRGSQRVGTPPR